FNYDELEDEYGEDLAELRMSKRKMASKAETTTMESIKNKKNTVCDIFSLYGNMDQHKRTEILAKFCKATSGVLISTVNVSFLYLFYLALTNKLFYNQFEIKLSIYEKKA